MKNWGCLVKGVDRLVKNRRRGVYLKLQIASEKMRRGILIYTVNKSPPFFTGRKLQPPVSYSDKSHCAL